MRPPLPLLHRWLLIGLAVGALSLLVGLLVLRAGYDADSTRCTYRLRRLAVATHTWIVDHGRRELPRWRDDAGVYDPMHAESIEQVLWPYLRGTVPSARAVDHAELKRTSMAVCPASGTTYRLNNDFAGHDLWGLIRAGGTWLARDREPASHRQAYQRGSWQVDLRGENQPDGPGGRLRPGVPYWRPARP